MSRPRTIHVTKRDHDRLAELIRTGARSGTRSATDTIAGSDEPHLRELRHELERAKVVDSERVPADVVTMNSTVVLKDLGTDESLTYTLVFPQDANIDDGKISILAPIGTAIFGYRTGDTIEWKVPAGTRKLRIESIVYQPEASGDFHL